MDKNEIILEEYKLYVEQKDKFVDRNFSTNKFYLILFFVNILAMIYTNDIVFMNFLKATLLFAISGTLICALWYINIDTYGTLIKIKYKNVIEKIEDLLPVKPFQEESTALKESREKKEFMFSDIQKLVATFGAIFFFAIFVSELTPLFIKVLIKLKELLLTVKVGI